jgi:alpha-beta hydrolase superfamily lysophospholipase
MRLLGLLLVACVVLPGCAALTIGEEDVFYPKPSVTPQTFDLEGVDLSTSFVPVTDSLSVNAWHLTQPEARTTVLFFGGNGFYLVQSKSYLQALTRPPANAFLWDYRGYGRSDGEPGVAAFRQDALTVYDHLVEERGVPPEQLLVWGHSLGSFLATHVAAERSVAGLVLENPATNVDDWVDHLIPWYVRLFLGVDVDPALREENNLDRLRTLTAPLLVVAGAEDNVTDPSMARRLYEAAGSAEKDLVVVEDGGHNGLHDDSAVRSAYRALVQRVVGARPPAADSSGGTTADAPGAAGP